MAPPIPQFLFSYLYALENAFVPHRRILPSALLSNAISLIKLRNYTSEETILFFDYKF
jgi:hypothetical protein